MHAAPVTPSGNAALLCRRGALWIALPLALVSETMRPLPLEPMTGMPHFVLGISVIRGEPVPVVDSATLLGAADATPRAAGRWVVLRVGGRRIALAVEAVEGIRSLIPDLRAPLPSLLRDAGAEVIAQIGVLDAGLLVLLEATKLLSASDWLALDRIAPA
ncbi:MAG: chemotaxis protein CheW [Myxococcaceae bacterium]|nr:chemotaxis protein CheW [Myxococcaceae bacterium]